MGQLVAKVYTTGKACGIILPANAEVELIDARIKKQNAKKRNRTYSRQDLVVTIMDTSIAIPRALITEAIDFAMSFGYTIKIIAPPQDKK